LPADDGLTTQKLNMSEVILQILSSPDIKL